MLQKKTYDNIFLLLSIDKKFLPRSPKKSSFLSKKDKYTLKWYRSFPRKYKLSKLNLEFDFGKTKKTSMYSNSFKTLINYLLKQDPSMIAQTKLVNTLKHKGV
jgi:hypothetical protein